MTDLRSLPPAELREVARRLAKPTTDRHWSVLAAVLGRIHDEQLYATFGYEDTVSFAERDMELGPGETLSLLKLWGLVKVAEGRIMPTEWATVSRAKALGIRRMVGLGGDVVDWFRKASAAESAASFREQVRQAMGKEAWRTFRVHAPADLIDKLFEPALVLALDKDAPAEQALERDTRFRCLERIVAEWVALPLRRLAAVTVPPIVR